MKPKAYSYVRFSTSEQARGDSKRRQYDAVVAYAAANDLDLVTDNEYSFLDAGISAFKGNNSNNAAASLKRFYDYVQEGKIAAGSYLLVESLDRLSREQLDLAVPRFLELLNCDINVVTLSDGTVYRKNPDMVKLIVSIIHMGRAHLESKIKGERVSKAWRNKQLVARLHNTPLGGACPQWLKFDGVAYRVLEGRADVVRRIFDLTIKGYGQRAIVKLLNSECVPVFGTEARNKSGLWGSSSVAKILGNRSVLGEYQPNIWEDGSRIVSGEPVLGYYPSIINETVFYAALDARKKRAVYKVTKQTKNFNVWSKVAACAYCKSPMHLVNKGLPPKGGKYLRCASAAKGVCNAKQIRLELSETMFKEILAKLDSVSLVKDNSRTLRKHISELEGRVLSAQAQLDEYALLLKQAPSRMLAEVAAEKEREIESLKSKHESTLAELSTDLIYNKDHFFAKLDLTSYEGRHLANQHVLRLKVRVLMKIELDETFFSVAVDGFPKFGYVVGSGGIVSFVPLALTSVRSALRQGDLDVTKFPISPQKVLTNALSGDDMEPYSDSLQGSHSTFVVKNTPKTIAALNSFIGKSKSVTGD